MSISVAQAKFVSLIIEGSLFGFSIFMAGLTLWILANSKRSPRTINAMIVVTVLLAILSVVHLVANGINADNGFVYSPDAHLYFLDIRKENFKNGVYFVQTLLGDGVLIWRCWAVWGRNYWVVILPALGWLAVLASGIGEIYTIGKPSTTATNVFVATVQWTPAFYGATLGTNLLTTGLLAGRIWAITRQAAKFSSSKTSYASRVIVTVVECGALYSASLVCMIIAFFVKSNASFLVIDIVGNIIPITFYLVIIRLMMPHVDSINAGSENLSVRSTWVAARYDSMERRNTVQGNAETGKYPSFGDKSPTQLSNRGHLEMEPIAVRIQKVTERDVDGEVGYAA